MKRGITGVVLFFLLAMSSVIPVSAAKLTGAYQADREVTWSNYAAAYGWDEDLLLEPDWESSVDGETREFQRLRGYQKEFYRDNMTTTFLQLGLMPGGYGGGGNMVAIALAEVGTSEEPMGSNNVSYNTWYYGRPVSGKDYPWCAAFISWCAEQAGYLESGLFRRTASSTEHYNYLTKTLGLPSYEVTESFLFGGYYTPVPGDIQLFRDNSGFCHIGIIVEVTESGWYTVEGNSSDRVKKNYYDSNCSSTARRGCIVNVAYPAEAGENAQLIYRFLTRVMGLPSSSACGALGNLEVLSTLDPSLDQGGYGIGQWRGIRRDTLINNVQLWGKGSLGANAGTTLEGQLWYLKWELEENYASLLTALRSLPDTLDGAKSASALLLQRWESGGDTGQVALEKRRQAAAIYYQQMGRGN